MREEVKGLQNNHLWIKKKNEWFMLVLDLDTIKMEQIQWLEFQIYELLGHLIGYAWRKPFSSK